MIFKNKLKKQMAWADVASEVGLQNGSAATRKEKVVSFERFLEPINVWVLIYCFFVLDAYVLFDEDQERERTTTPIHLLRPPSWNTRLRLRIALCLRLRWTCELPCACVCACVCVCVARVNQPSPNLPAQVTNQLNLYLHDAMVLLFPYLCNEERKQSRCFECWSFVIERESY